MTTPAPLSGFVRGCSGNKSIAAFLRTKCRSLWQEARQFLSFFDLVRFCRYLPVIDEQKEAVNQKKNSNNLHLLFQHRFGNQTSFKQNNIVNLSDYKLSDTERFVFSDGLSFCLPPTSVKQFVFLVKSHPLGGNCYTKPS